MIVTAIQGNRSIAPAENVDSVLSTASTAAGERTLPAAQSLTAVLNDADLPALPLSQRGVSIDSILTALADESRRNSIKASVEALQSQGEAQAAENEKKLEQIQKQINSAKKESFWNKFCKAFKIIGVIVGVVASAATIAAGALSANPALVAAGVFGVVATTDSLVSLASDGKYSIASGFAKLGQALGMSENASQWFGFAMNMVLIVAGIACSFGAAGASASASAANAAEKGAKALNAVTKIGTASNAASGATGVAAGIGNAGLTIARYQTAKIKAKKIDIDALLETLRSEMKTTQDLIKTEMQAADRLMADVKAIVEDCGRTATAVLTANPSVA